MSIHEAVSQCKEAGNVELIDIPVGGDPIVLLRTKEMPEFAFVMWVDKHSGTFSQMAFEGSEHGRDYRYLVVCACCGSETYGLECPKGRDEKEWEKEMAVPFKQAIVKTCREKGISVLFMRRADSWSDHYGDVKGLEVVEAMKHKDAMCELYGRKVVREVLQFIDMDKSRGMK